MNTLSIYAKIYRPKQPESTTGMAGLSLSVMESLYSHWQALQTPKDLKLRIAIVTPIKRGLCAVLTRSIYIRVDYER